MAEIVWISETPSNAAAVAIAEAAGASSSMKGNPVPLSRDVLESVLRAAL